jgi:ATP synthase protein I
MIKSFLVIGTVPVDDEILPNILVKFSSQDLRMMCMREQKSKDSPWRAIGLVSAIGIDLGLGTFLGFLGGSYLDKLLGSEPVGMVVGVLLGLLMGIVGITFLVKLFSED